MGYRRKGFYLIPSFTFPEFWVFHAGGLMSGLYFPLQNIFYTKATGRPSFVTAVLLYFGSIVLFELFARAWKNARP